MFLGMIVVVNCLFQIMIIINLLKIAQRIKLFQLNNVIIIISFKNIFLLSCVHIIISKDVRFEAVKQLFQTFKVKGDHSEV